MKVAGNGSIVCRRSGCRVSRHARSSLSPVRSVTDTPPLLPRGSRRAQRETSTCRGGYFWRRVAWALLVFFTAGDRLAALEGDVAVSQYAHNSWGRRDGLPTNAILSLTQGPDGFIWVGTTGGLTRFDGVSFTQEPANAVDPRRREAVSSLLATPDGSLFVGLRSGGVRERRDNRILQRHPDVIDPTVRCLHRDAAGVVRVGTAVGLFELYPDGRCVAVPTVHPYISDITTDAGGNVYLATQAGVQVLGQRASTITLPAAQNVTERVLVDRDGTLWIGTFHGLVRWREGSWQLFGREHGLPGEHITSLLEDRDGNIWVGTMEGVVRLARDGTRGPGDLNRLLMKPVTSMLEDREGSLWLGTQDGLHRLKDVSVVSWGEAEGLLSSAVAAVNGLADGSVVVFHNGEPTGLSLLRDGVIRTRTDVLDGPSYLDAEGALWIANTGLLQRIGPEGVTRFGAEKGLPPLWIGAVGADRQSMLVAFGQMGGIRRFTTEGIQPYLLRDGTPFQVPFHVMSMLTEPSGVVWMATYDGIWRLRDGEVTRFTSELGERTMGAWYRENPPGPHHRTIIVPELLDNWFTSIAQGSDGSLWFASHRTGMTRYKDGVFRSLSARDGLVSDELYSVLAAEGGDIWGSCAYGIFRLRADELGAFFEGKQSRVHPRLYTSEDGMKTDEATHEYQPAAWKGPDGTLWFATRRGVASVNPSRLRHNPVPPPVVVERIVADGEGIAFTPEATIAPGRNKFDIHYTALSLLSPERVLFRYRLEGYDQGWIDAGAQRVAHYTKLPPGRYVFRVTACNNDGVWSESGASLAFTVKPFLHQTGWFAGACLAALVGLVYAVHRWRVRTLRVREAALQQRVHERTVELSRVNESLTREIAERQRAEGEVERVHSQLLQASHQAGMAEVATGVLHNVGNVLNSVNVSTTVLAETMARSRAGNLERVAAMLAEHEKDLAGFLSRDPRGNRIPGYLRELAVALTAEQRRMSEEVRTVQTNIDHIKNIVTMQQDYARVSGVAERVGAAELIREALLMNAASLSRHHVRVDHVLEPSAGSLLVEKHRVLQILVNLISNAKHACVQSGREDPVVTLRTWRVGERVGFEVADNGVGIAPENLVRIFSHGFTTRPDGHGFGLHSGALAAKALGGSLRAESEGLGTGARFILELPAEPAAAPQRSDEERPVS